MNALSRQPLCAEPKKLVNAEPMGNVAQILPFTKTKLPEQTEDFGHACTKMIWATFPGRSQWDVCQQAAAHLGTSPDTIERILQGKTKHPDPRLMFAVLPIYQAKHGKGFSIGGGLEVRIIVTGAK